MGMVRPTEGGQKYMRVGNLTSENHLLLTSPFLKTRAERWTGVKWTITCCICFHMISAIAQDPATFTNDTLFVSVAVKKNPSK